MKPVLQSILLADRVYQDKASGKHIIVGVFSQLLLVPNANKPKTKNVDGKPQQIIQGGMQAGSPYVYISITEVRGKVPCELRYVDLNEDQPIYQIRFEIQCDNPLKTIEATFPFPALPHRVGTFAVELLCNDELVGSHRVVVENVKPPEEPKEEAE